MRLAIERVFANIKIERGQIDRAKLKNRMKRLFKVISLIGLTHQLIKLIKPMQNHPLQLRHIFIRNTQCLIIMMQIAQQKPQRVAQLAIAIHTGLDHLLANALIFPIISGHHPQPEDIRPILFDHILRRDSIFPRLGHLLALVIKGKPMG